MTSFEEACGVGDLDRLKCLFDVSSIPLEEIEVGLFSRMLTLFLPLMYLNFSNFDLLICFYYCPIYFIK
jgi:hypothetical protein